MTTRALVTLVAGLLRTMMVRGRRLVLSLQIATILIRSRLTLLFTANANTLIVSTTEIGLNDRMNSGRISRRWEW